MRCLAHRKCDIFVPHSHATHGRSEITLIFATCHLLRQKISAASSKTLRQRRTFLHPRHCRAVSGRPVYPSFLFVLLSPTCLPRRIVRLALSPEHAPQKPARKLARTKALPQLIARARITARTTAQSQPIARGRAATSRRPSRRGAANASQTTHPAPLPWPGMQQGPLQAVVMAHRKKEVDEGEEKKGSRGEDRHHRGRTWHCFGDN